MTCLLVIFYISSSILVLFSVIMAIWWIVPTILGLSLLLIEFAVILLSRIIRNTFHYFPSL